MLSYTLHAYHPSHQLLPLQPPPYPRYPTLAHHPKLPQLLPHPREILHRIIRLHPDQQLPARAEHINPLPRPRNHIPIPRHLQSIRRPIGGKIKRPFIGQIRRVVAEVEGVNGAFVRGVEGGALGREERGDGTGDGARVGDVDGAGVGGEGDAVGLDEGVVDEGEGAGAGAEAVGGGRELGRGVG